MMIYYRLKIVCLLLSVNVLSGCLGVTRVADFQLTELYSSPLSTLEKIVTDPKDSKQFFLFEAQKTADLLVPYSGKNLDIKELSGDKWETTNVITANRDGVATTVSGSSFGERWFLKPVKIVEGVEIYGVEIAQQDVKSRKWSSLLTFCQLFDQSRIKCIDPKKMQEILVKLYLSNLVKNGNITTPEGIHLKRIVNETNGTISYEANLRLSGTKEILYSLASELISDVQIKDTLWVMLN